MSWTRDLTKTWNWTALNKQRDPLVQTAPVVTTTFSRLGRVSSVIKPRKGSFPKTTQMQVPQASWEWQTVRLAVRKLSQCMGYILHRKSRTQTTRDWPKREIRCWYVCYVSSRTLKQWVSEHHRFTPENRNKVRHASLFKQEVHYISLSEQTRPWPAQRYG